MIKFLKIIFLLIFLTTNAVAGSDGNLELSNKSKSTKDCFEPLNRATFALNQGLDKAILKPIVWNNYIVNSKNYSNRYT